MRRVVARRAARVAAGVVGVGAVLLGAAVLGAEPLLNSDAVRGRVLASVERATGHGVRLGGRVELTPGSLLALTPVIGVQDVTLLNEPGFSREALASARRVEVKLVLLPLLAGRVEVGSVTLVGPDVLLERDAGGRGNWERPAVPDAGAEKAEAPRGRMPVELGPVRVLNGRVVWQGAPAVDVPLMAVTPSGGRVDGMLLINGVELGIGGHTEASGAFEVTATGGGVVLGVSGQGDQGVEFRAAAGVLEAASKLVGQPLPPLRDVVVTGRAGPGGLTGLHGEVGASEVGVRGLRLLQVRMDAADLGKPVQVLATVAWGALPIAVAGSFGPLDRAKRAPVALQASVDGGVIGAQGVVDVAARSGEGVISARMPDLGRTSALAGVAAPALRDVALDVRVAPGPGGTMLLRGLRLASSQGDVAGDLAVGWSPRPVLRGSLVSTQLLLDMPAGPSAAPTTAGPAPVVTPEGGAASGPVLPDRGLPFERLRLADADVQLSVGQLVYRGVTYRGLVARGLLQEGRLRVDPVRMTGPGGALEGQAVVDAAAAPPTVAVTVRTPGIDAGVFMPGVSGTVELNVALQARGGSVHALAASLTGHAAMALVDGEIENAELARVFGGVLRGANVPVDEAGRSRVHCMAARMEAEGGQARVTTLALDTTRLRVEGDGTADLGAETLDMHLRPVIRIGGTGVAVPVRVVGPWRAPRPSADRGVVAPGRFGISIGVPLADPCGPALAAVRAP